MGVPKFAAWLTRKYPNMVINVCPEDVHGLYIDLNGLIHPCCHDEHDATVALRSEVEKLRSVCLSIETLVVTVKPKHVLYIAIDGVAPRAKMNQQRARRYMSAGTPLTNTEKPAHGAGSEISAGVVAAIGREFTPDERVRAEQELEDVNQALKGDVLYGDCGGGGSGFTANAGAEDAQAVRIVAAESTEGAAATATTNTSQQKLMLPPADESSTAPASPVGADVLAERFDSNCISPGTAFMDKVAAAVRDFVKCKLAPTKSEAEVTNGDAAGDDSFTSLPSSANLTEAPSTPSVWSNLTVVFSDSNTAGEGEHKLSDFLRTQSAFPGFNSGGYHVIAGLDADLIFLSLALHIPRIVILRDFERSSYEKALLPIAVGGTLTSQKDLKKTPAAAVSKSNVTSSTDSTATMTTTTTVGAERASATPLLSDAVVVTPTPCRDGQTVMRNDYNGDESNNYTFESETEEAVNFPKNASLSPASPALPPHISTVVADVNTSYEYYDIDVVGASLVSEIYQLCLEKGMEVQGDPLTNLANCVASNGFNFHRSREVAAAAGKEENSRTKESSSIASSTPVQPPPAFHPCTATSNSKIIDDFIVLGMLLGNDFLPHSPSVYCGESAMDTLLDVYVSAVLPHGYLTGGFCEIQLLQLERLFRAYAAVEAVRFRQHAIQVGLMTPREAATAELYSQADRRCWRDTYIRTTSLRDEAGVQAACRAYVEGLRFVWRYYSSISLQVSWSWYYPFHHAPLALDVANFLRAQGPNVQATLAAPKLERLPPPPFCQLLCILPPTSRALVPAALQPFMVNPPLELADTFPKTWTVDFTGAYGQEHLAAVLLPFANLPHLQQLVQREAHAYTPEERARNALRSTHIVIENRVDTGAETGSQQHRNASEAEDEGAHEREMPKRGTAAAAAAAKARGFRIQGGGLQLLTNADIPAELQGCASLVCSSLADVVPPLSRPRTYSHTVPIPGLTVQSNDTRVPLDRRSQNHYGNRRRRGNVRMEEEIPNTKDASDAGYITTAATATANVHAAKPSMLFGEFAICLVVFGLLTATVSVCRSTTMVNSVQLVLQLCGIALTVLGLMFALGLAVAGKGRTPGSGMHRHSTFMAFADWQCRVCLSLNFARNRRCFMCRAPFDPKRCLAVFSSKNAPEPPLMDPDHAAYGALYGIISM